MSLLPNRSLINVISQPGEKVLSLLCMPTYFQIFAHWGCPQKALCCTIRERALIDMVLAGVQPVQFSIANRWDNGPRGPPWEHIPLKAGVALIYQLVGT